MHFSIRKKWHSSSSPVKANNFNLLKPDQRTLNRRPNPIKMTNQRCTADHHAVPPLNIRPVEDGIIPDHFSTGRKYYSAHHDLSERARPTPAVFQTNIQSPRSRPAHCRFVFFPEQETMGVGRLSSVRGERGRGLPPVHPSPHH